ncbi:MAG: hypothetical protein ABWZ42_07055 [Ilumatobacteraceae bacterium]
MLSISALRPLTVTRGDDPIEIPPGKTPELLVRLALDPGAIVRGDRLLAGQGAR